MPHCKLWSEAALSLMRANLIHGWLFDANGLCFPVVPRQEQGVMLPRVTWLP